MEVRRAAERTDEIEKAPVKLGDGHRAEGKVRPAPVGGGSGDPVVEEIEADFDAARAVGNERGREAARIDVERRVPGMVDPGRASEPILADDLRVEVQCGACL